METHQPNPNPNPTPTPTDRRSTLLTWLLLVLLVLALSYRIFQPYLVSLISGAVFAIIFYPLYARLRRYMPPLAAGLIVTLGVVVLVLVPLTLMVIGATRQAVALVNQLSEGGGLNVDRAIATVRGWLPMADSFGTPEELRTQLREGVGTALQAVSGFLLRQVASLPNILLQLVLVVLATYFFLVDGRAFVRWLSGKVPLSRQIRRALAQGIKGATNAVVLATIAAAGAQALVLLSAYGVLGVPAAFLAAGAAFLLAFIPTVGTVPVWGIGAAWLYFQDRVGAMAVMIGVGLFVSVLDNVVRPWVLRGREEMHPLVSLVAILGGIAILGIPGAFLGPLMVSVAKSVLDLWPAVANYAGIALTDAGDEVPEMPMLDPLQNGGHPAKV